MEAFMDRNELEIRVGDWSVGLRPDLGGCLSHFRQYSPGDGVTDWLRPLEGDDALQSACYPLVPFSNRIDQGRFTQDGQEIQLPLNFPPEPHAIHGFGCWRPWEVAAQHVDSVTLAYNHEPDAWPWAFRAEQVVSLTDGRLSIGLSVTNQAESLMPVGLGLHPFFAKAVPAAVRMHVAAIHETDEFCMPVRRNIHHPVLTDFAGGKRLREGLDNCFDGWDGQAQLSWADGRRMTMTSNGLANHVVVYSPEGEDFFCVEPVTHMTDAANRQDSDWGGNTGWRQLPPGEELTLTMALAAQAAG